MTNSKKRAVAKKIVAKKRPVIKTAATEVEIPKARVFLDQHAKSFLLLTEHEHHNRYLTLGDDGIQVVKLQHAAPVRNDKGFLPEETTSIADLRALDDYDYEQAVGRYYNSFLQRTPEAVRAMCEILGKSIPEVSVEVVAIRTAKIERLQKARAARNASRSDQKKDGKITTISGFPTSDAVVTIVTGASAPIKGGAVETLAALKKAGQPQTVGQLRKAVGRPVYSFVMKLVELGLVTLS